MLSSFGISLGNHCRLIRKDKKELMKKTKIQPSKALKEIDTSMMSLKGSVYQARQLLIHELKIIRNQLINEQEEQLKTEERGESQKNYCKKLY